MSNTRELLRRGVEGFEPTPDAFERVLARRDRKRRNQRIAAGVVGIAVFVAAVWIVTSVSSLDRNGTSVGPAGDVTGPAETGPAEEPPRAPAQPFADGVQGWCSLLKPGGARSRLELTDIGDRIKVRFEVYRSQVGHEWHIQLRHHSPTIPFPPPWPNSRVLFQGTRVTRDSGVLAVQVFFPDLTGLDGYWASAVDEQTGQHCKASGWIE